MTFGCLFRWDFTRASGMVLFDVLQQSFKDRFSKTHVISNHDAKVENKCAVFLRSQKKF